MKRWIHAATTSRDLIDDFFDNQKDYFTENDYKKPLKRLQSVEGLDRGDIIVMELSPGRYKMLKVRPFAKDHFAESAQDATGKGYELKDFNPGVSAFRNGDGWYCYTF